MLFAIKSVSNMQKDNIIYRRINYLHVTKTSSSRSVSCIFGVVLLPESEPRRQTNADLKMVNESDSSPNPCDSGSITLLFLHYQ